jgi:fimbrial chaperone protein
MRPWHTGAATALAVAFAACSADAASLAISPVSIERIAPASAATLALNNGAEQPLNAQIRVFQWRQGPAGDSLTPTRNVVVSPPIVTLKPHADYTVRIIRIAKTPVAGEEAYRILVDQLPENAGDGAEASVSLLLRYSVPVFFRAARNVAPAALAWRVSRGDGAYVIHASNRGEARIRVSEMSLVPAAGKPVALSGGLVGYVLGGSQVTWTLPALARITGAATLQFNSDEGEIHVPVVVQAGD